MPEPQQRGSLTHWARAGIEPAAPWFLAVFVNHCTTMGTPQHKDNLHYTPTHTQAPSWPWIILKHKANSIHILLLVNSSVGMWKNQGLKRTHNHNTVITLLKLKCPKYHQIFSQHSDFPNCHSILFFSLTVCRNRIWIKSTHCNWLIGLLRVF